MRVQIGVVDDDLCRDGRGGEGAGGASPVRGGTVVQLCVSVRASPVCDGTVVCASPVRSRTLPSRNVRGGGGFFTATPTRNELYKYESKSESKSKSTIDVCLDV